MGEKAFMMRVASKVKVICLRVRKSPPLMHDGKREIITALETISADGRVLPSMMIYKELLTTEAGMNFSFLRIILCLHFLLRGGPNRYYAWSIYV